MEYVKSSRSEKETSMFKERRNEEAAKNENQDSETHKERRAKIEATKSEVRVTGISVGSYIKPIS
jgi:hypothetical protein